MGNLEPLTKVSKDITCILSTIIRNELTSTIIRNYANKGIPYLEMNALKTLVATALADAHSR